MARSRRGGRTSGGHGRRGEAAPVEAVPLEFAEPERPSRRGTSRGSRSSGGGGGMGIGLVIPLAVTVLAAVCLLLTGFLTANSAKSGMDQVLDKTGVAAALALASSDVDAWNPAQGTESFWNQLMAKKAESLRKLNEKDNDSRNKEIVDKAYKEFCEKMGIEQDPSSGERAKAVASETLDRLKRIVNVENSPIIYAAVARPGGSAIANSGNRKPVESPLGGSFEIAGVKVQRAILNGAPGRIYVAPMRSEIGEKDKGEAWVYLTARPVYEASKGLTGTFLLLSLVGIVLVGGVAFVLCMGASKGVKRVTSDLDQVARGDLDVRISARGGGEVGSLARAAERAMKTFRAVQEQSITAVTAQPAVPVEAEIDTSALLPVEPPRVDGYEIEAVHKPCSPSANDYYDYFTVDATHLGIVIADMPHAGAQGAFTASTFRALMRAYAPEETSPAAVLGRVNRIMANELKRGDHISAMYAVLDTEKGIAAVASAGHLPLVFWKLEKKGSALLNPEGIAIGLDKGPVFEKTVVDKRIKLDRGDRLVIYTDGPVAATNINGEEFGEQRFYYLVNREAPKNSAAFVNFVANEVDLFHEGAPQQDDITIVTVRKVKG